MLVADGDDECGCGNHATVATPDGMLCESCADLLWGDLRGE